MKVRNLRAERLAGNITMTVKVKGVKALAIRIWLGAQIIKVAAFVIGCGIKIETKDNGNK